MTTPFNALIIDKNDTKISASMKQISLADLPDEEVLVDVAYSTTVCWLTGLVCRNATGAAMPKSNG